MTFFLVLITRKNILTCKTQMNLYHGFGNFLANPPPPGWPWVALDCGLIGILCTLNGHRFFLVRSSSSWWGETSVKDHLRKISLRMSIVLCLSWICILDFVSITTGNLSLSHSLPVQQRQMFQLCPFALSISSLKVALSICSFCSFHFKLKSYSLHLLFLLFPFQVKNSLCSFARFALSI